MTMSTSAGHTPWLPAQLKALPKLPSGLAPCWYNTTRHYALRGAYDGYKMSIPHECTAGQELMSKCMKLKCAIEMHVVAFPQMILYSLC